MSPEEKLEMGRKLIAEAEAEIAAKKRNWPEKIVRGMCFEQEGVRYIMAQRDQLVNVSTGETYAGEEGFDGDEAKFTYLGHARDLIKIANDAHEPTGAELVGKRCEYCDTDSDWSHWNTGLCKDFVPGADQPYLRDQGGKFRFARLAR